MTGRGAMSETTIEIPGEPPWAWVEYEDPVTRSWFRNLEFVIRRYKPGTDDGHTIHMSIPGEEVKLMEPELMAQIQTDMVKDALEVLAKDGYTKKDRFGR